MDLVHDLCPLQLLEVTKKSDNLSGFLASIQHLAVKAVVAAFNQEKALVGAFSVIMNLRICFGWNFLKH